MSEELKVILIGPYPPPLGGISVHIRRIKQVLELQNIRTLVYNESNFPLEDQALGMQQGNIKPIKSYRTWIFKLPFIRGDVFHFPCIASDCRLRQEGTLLYKKGNVDDLVDKVKDVMVRYRFYKDTYLALTVPDNAEPLINLYKSISRDKQNERRNT